MGMVYDGAMHSTLLFGGAAWGQGSIYGARCLPPMHPRQRQGIAFDAAAANAVLFGGSTTAPLSSGSSLADTWTWDGTNWTQQFPPISPPARTWTSIACDEASRTVFLFGGSNLTPLPSSGHTSGKYFQPPATSTSQSPEAN